MTLLTPEQKIEQILELIKLETCDKTYTQSNGTQSWQMPEQFISIAGKEEAKQAILTLKKKWLIDEIKIMQHQAFNVLKSAKAVGEWGDIRINQLNGDK